MPLCTVLRSCACVRSNGVDPILKGFWRAHQSAHYIKKTLSVALMSPQGGAGIQCVCKISQKNKEEKG